MESSSIISRGPVLIVFMELGIQSSDLSRRTRQDVWYCIRKSFPGTCHLPWQKLLKTNKKGTIDNFFNSRLVLDCICMTVCTVGHTVSNFLFFLIPATRSCTPCIYVYIYRPVITLEVQNTWHKGLGQSFLGSDKSVCLQVWLVQNKSVLQNMI